MLPFALIALAVLYASQSRRAAAQPGCAAPATLAGPATSVKPSAVNPCKPNALFLIPQFVTAPPGPVLPAHCGTGILGVPFACQNTKAGRIRLCRAEDRQCYIFHTRIAPAVSLGKCNPGGTNLLDISDNFR